MKQLPPLLSPHSSLSMLSSSFAIAEAAIVLMLSEAVVKPIAIAVFERIMLPNLSEVLSRDINPNMGLWLSECQTSEEMADKVATVLNAKITGFSAKPAALKQPVVRAVLNKYNPGISVEHMDSAPASIRVDSPDLN